MNVVSKSILPVFLILNIILCFMAWIRYFVFGDAGSSLVAWTFLLLSCLAIWTHVRILVLQERISVLERHKGAAIEGKAGQDE